MTAPADPLRDAVEKAMRAKCHQLTGIPLGLYIDEAVAVAVEMIRQEQAHLGERLASEIHEHHAALARAEAAERDREHIQQHRDELQQERDEARIVATKESLKRFGVETALAEYREKFGHVAQCDCCEPGELICKHSIHVHPKRDPRCAPEVKG